MGGQKYDQRVFKNNLVFQINQYIKYLIKILYIEKFLKKMKAMTEDGRLSIQTMEKLVYDHLAKKANRLKLQLEEAISLNKQLLLQSHRRTHVEQEQLWNPVKVEQDPFWQKINTQTKKVVQGNSLADNNRQRQNGQRRSCLKNDTKNIPKNFGTAIVLFINRNIPKVKRSLSGSEVSLPQFLNFSKKMKTSLNSLIDLRKVWAPEDDDPEKQLKIRFRVISFCFLRKHSLSYIFNSRIKNIYSHIKYSKKMLQGLKEPINLTNLKDY